MAADLYVQIDICTNMLYTFIYGERERDRLWGFRYAKQRLKYVKKIYFEAQSMYVNTFFGTQRK